jgi:hypothetical protein
MLKSSYEKYIKPIYNQMDLIKTSGFKDSLLIMEQKVNPIHVNKCNLDLA